MDYPTNNHNSEKGDHNFNRFNNHKPSEHHKHPDHKPNDHGLNEHRPNEHRPEDHKTHGPHPPKKDHFPKIDNSPDSLRIKNPWKIAAIVLGVITIALLYMMYSGTSPLASSTTGEEAGEIIIDYLNSRTGGGVTYISNTDLGFLYEITVSYNSNHHTLIFHHFVHKGHFLP